MPKEKRLLPNKKRIVIVLLVLAFLFLLFIFLPKLINLTKTEDTQTQQEITSSDKVTLSIQTDKETFEIGETISVKVYVNTAGKAINAVGIKLNFPVDLVEVEKSDTTESFCTLFPENSFDNDLGLITYSCGLPTPGLTDDNGLVGTFYIKLKKTGTVNLTLTDECQVLANDGLGTDLLSETIGAQFAISD